MKPFNREIMLGGSTRKVGTPQVRVLEINLAGNVTRADGATVPSDGDKGYAVGCLFVLTGGSTPATLYVNVGTAASADFNSLKASTPVVNVTGSTLTVDPAVHDGSIVTLNRAAGIAVTLPAATGSGARYRFVVGTTFTSAATIKVTGNDIMKGTATLYADGGDTVVGFGTAADSDTIDLLGIANSVGGIVGEDIELIDIAADTWFVRIVSDAGGTEATPFSATVS